ncbi:MAG: hypothetical protein BA863_18860 [Desulfovibrio sp. S3730MH75]|nr:MAG: hypothetical protein BA863_18860 [Desulfovibrio sp. S3730MH75]
MILGESVILVAGGAGDIGSYISSDLAKNGANVFVADRCKEKLSELSPSLKTIYMDAAEPESVQQMVDQVIAQAGRIDVLINCAGRIYSEPLINISNYPKLQHDYSKFAEIVASNLHTAFILGAAVAEQMVKLRTKGLILNFSSISAQGNAGQTAYAAAKAGVEAMTKVWAKELGTLGIRSVAIAPGFIETPSTHNALNEKLVKHIIQGTPLRRLGSLEEIGIAVLHAIENDFLNGTTVEINGGLTL